MSVSSKPSLPRMRSKVALPTEVDSSTSAALSCLTSQSNCRTSPTRGMRLPRSSPPASGALAIRPRRTLATGVGSPCCPKTGRGLRHPCWQHTDAPRIANAAHRERSPLGVLPGGEIFALESFFVRARWSLAIRIARPPSENFCFLLARAPPPLVAQPWTSFNASHRAPQ